MKYDFYQKRNNQFKFKESLLRFNYGRLLFYLDRLESQLNDRRFSYAITLEDIDFLLDSNFIKSLKKNVLLLLGQLLYVVLEILFGLKV